MRLGVSQVDNWKQAQKNQWVIKAKQLEQDESMTAHREQPHVSREQIEVLEPKLSAIEEKADKALRSSPRVEDVPIEIKVPSRR
jgi:hypothetical protein